MKWLPQWPALLFVAALALVVVAGVLPVEFLFWPACFSLISLCLYGRDKYAAVHNRWRISEATLHFWSLGGGWPGALVGQRLFNHKTSKRPFRTVFWCTVFGNCALIAWCLSDDGRRLVWGAIALAQHWLAQLGVALAAV